jgi:hypothetical protein
LATRDSIPASEITPPEVYFNRRAILRGGAIAAGIAATALLYRKLDGLGLVTTDTAELVGVTRPQAPIAPCTIASSPTRADHVEISVKARAVPLGHLRSVQDEAGDRTRDDGGPGRPHVGRPREGARPRLSGACDARRGRRRLI